MTQLFPHTRQHIGLIRGMLILSLVGVVLVSGCGKSINHGLNIDPTAVNFSALLSPSDCTPLPGQPLKGGTLVLALTDSVDCTRAPIPSNFSEQIVFGNLYETLVNVDCSGRLLPGIAQSWQTNVDGTVWDFVLRDMRFWDGTPVSSAIIKECWSTNRAHPAASDLNPPWLWFQPEAESIQTISPTHLRITLREPFANLPYLLAHTAYAIAIRQPGWIWPVGSGPCRLRPSTSIPIPDIHCLPNIHHPERPTWDKLVFRVMPGSDPRDLLNNNCDAVLAQDRVSLDYFAGSPGLHIVPLPWDHLYLLVCPPRRDKYLARYLALRMAA